MVRGDVEAAQRLGTMLARFWQMGHYPQEGRTYLTELLRLPVVSQAARALVQVEAGLLAVYQADFAAAHEIKIPERRSSAGSDGRRRLR